MKLSPFAKQMFVGTATQLAAVSMGASLGYPCVLLQQIQSNETTIQADFDTLTWIASMHGLSGIGATLMPAIMQLKGRKYTFIGSCLLLLIGWILAFVATDTYVVLLSAIFHGLATNCITIVNLVTVSEMIAPKYRSTSMILLNINQACGIVIVATLGTVVNWKTVAIIMCGPILLALAIVCLWPESPSWLACKGKFEACEQAFIWLRGTDDDAIRELKSMIAAQKEIKRKTSKKTTLQEMFQKIKSKDFYKPSLYMFLILFNYYSCGAVSLFMYSKDVIETATGDPKMAVIGYVATAYIVLSGSFLSLLLIRFFKTKTVLSTGFGCILSLLCCSFVQYLKSVGFVATDSFLFVYFFFAYMVFSSSGFTPVTYALVIDLVPVKHRGFGGALFNILTCLFYVVTVKTLPYVLRSLGIPIAFIMFASVSLVCTILIWIYVPETKNRTLQEIEDFYTYGSFVRQRDLNDVEVNTPIVRNSIEE